MFRRVTSRIKRGSWRRHLKFASAVALLAVAVVASSSVGVPHDEHGTETLPSVAMDWRLLFHVERASALLGTLGIILLIAWRGARGEWPIKFGNVEYAPKEAITVAADALEKQDRRLRIIETELERLENADR